MVLTTARDYKVLALYSIWPTESEERAFCDIEVSLPPAVFCIAAHCYLPQRATIPPLRGSTNPL